MIALRKIHWIRNNLPMKFSHKTCVSALVVALSALVVTDAKAALIYELFFGQPVYQTVAGQDITVNFFLRETATGGSIHRISATNGLTRGNIGIEWDSGGFTAESANYGSGFDGIPKSISLTPD